MMKSFKIIICTLLTTVLLLSGCSRVEESTVSDDHLANSCTSPTVSDEHRDGSGSSYTVLTCDFSDSISGVSLTREFDTRRGDLDEKDIPKTKTVMINGKQRKGTFSGAEKYGLRSYEEFNYDNETLGEFRLDEEGNLTMCCWETASNNGKKLTQEECLQIAKDFLADRINIDQYQVKVEYQEKYGEYEFVFRKYIGEFETMDMAGVFVLENGELSFFNSIMLDRIPADTPIPFDREKATASVYAKLDALYAPVKDENTSIEYELDPFQVTILENGETALRCMVSVECKKPYGDGYTLQTGDRLELIICNET